MVARMESNENKISDAYRGQAAIGGGMASHQNCRCFVSLGDGTELV